MIFNGIEDISIPTWIEKPPPKVGLDLLGLRNPVLSIGNIYLSGITTITPTIRYLSFRSWIIWKYAQLRLPDSLKVMNEFASKIETAIVFSNLLVKRDTYGLIGRNEGVHIIESGVNPLPLERLVKGQIALSIYTGPSLQLGIGKDIESEVHGISTERGLPLALEIDRQIEDTEFYLYVDDILNADAIETEVLRELGSVLHVEKIPDSEKGLLIDAVIPKKPINQSEIIRVTTYSLLLQLSENLKTEPEPSDVFTASINPAPDLPEIFKSVLDGWLMYTTRDMLAIVHEAVLEWSVDLLPTDKKKYTTTNLDITNELVSNDEEIDNTLRKFGILNKDESFKELRYKEILKRCKKRMQQPVSSNGICRWNGDFHELKLYDSAWDDSYGIIALMPIAWIMAACRVTDDRDTMAFQANLLSYKEGIDRFGLKQVILPRLKRYENKNMFFPDIISEMIQLTVDQHLRIAWSRMANNSENVALMYSDGDNWISISEREFEGGQIASRIEEAVGWLAQLGLINKDGISEKGKMILEQGYNTLTVNK